MLAALANLGNTNLGYSLPRDAAIREKQSVKSEAKWNGVMVYVATLLGTVAYADQPRPIV